MNLLFFSLSILIQLKCGFPIAVSCNITSLCFVIGPFSYMRFDLYLRQYYHGLLVHLNVTTHQVATEKLYFYKKSLVTINHFIDKIVSVHYFLSIKLY